MSSKVKHFLTDLCFLLYLLCHDYDIYGMHIEQNNNSRYRLCDSCLLHGCGARGHGDDRLASLASSTMSGGGPDIYIGTCSIMNLKDSLSQHHLRPCHVIFKSLGSNMYEIRRL